MPHIDSNGQRLFYDTGGDGPPLLFSHGLHMDHRMFEPQIEALRQDYRCIAWDERGHGATVTDEAHAVLDLRFGRRRRRAARRSRHRAGGLDRHVPGRLSLPAGRTHPSGARRGTGAHRQPGPARARRAHRNPSTGGRPLGRTRPDAGDGRQHRRAHPRRRQRPRRAVEVALGGVLRANVARIYATLDTRDDISDRLGEIDVPALVIGEADRAIDMTLAEEMAARLPRAELVRIPGAGHAANLTHPAAVNPPLTAFSPASPAAAAARASRRRRERHVSCIVSRRAASGITP